MNGKIKNAFLEIHADETLKKQVFENITANKAKKNIATGYKLIPVMAAFFLFVFGNIYFTPVSYISIDINPSIELSVNIFDRVIEATASNEDGENIINSVNLTNLNYIKALETLDGSEKFSDFTESYTEITVIAEKSGEIIDNIESCSFNNHNISFHSANLELKEQATQNGISFGKYRAYLELLEVNENIKIDEIATLPMKDIRELIEKGEVFSEDIPQHGNGNNNQDSQNQGSGGGNQHGKE